MPTAERYQYVRRLEKGGIFSVNSLVSIVLGWLATYHITKELTSGPDFALGVV